MSIKIPRLVIAGLSGDSGKTIASLSLLTALRQRGLAISVFKKGPDYIDAAWLTLFAGCDCRNLDTYMVERAMVLNTFIMAARKSDFALIEGNRGLFDGKDVEGTHSTAELAGLLDSPVVLVVDATKATRTLAAIVKGCLDFASGINIAGVILNKVAGRRHEQIVTATIKKYCNIPVLGVIPKLDRDKALLPGRHLGLITPFEFEDEVLLRQQLSRVATDYLNIDALLALAESAPKLDNNNEIMARKTAPIIKVGYFRDSVFTFYYPENLEALVESGAELVPVSSLEDKKLPDIDALYIGGGFPETHAEKLALNGSLMISVKDAVEHGLPVYAECGGLIYLSRSLTWYDKRFPMAGIFPVDLNMESKPVGHGYTLLQVDRPNPFFDTGVTFKGHEFHYSTVTSHFDMADTCLAVRTGTGLGQQRDGLLYKNCFGSYSHIHAKGVVSWAPAVTARAQIYQRSKNQRNEVQKESLTERPRSVINTYRVAGASG